MDPLDNASRRELLLTVVLLAKIYDGSEGYLTLSNELDHLVDEIADDGLAAALGEKRRRLPRSGVAGG